MQKIVSIEDIYKLFKKYGDLNLKVKTPFGFFKINNCDITAKNEEIYEIETESGKKLQCSYNHKLKIINEKFIKIKKIKLNKTQIITQHGIEKIIFVKNINKREDLFDIEVNQVKQYYSNDIVSHNSSFVDTIIYGLFNKSFRVSKVADIINNQSSDCSVQITLNDSNNQYRITRNSKKNDKGSTSTKVNFEKMLNEDWIPITEGSRTDIDKDIRRLVGTYDDFIISSCSPQGKSSFFLDSGLEDTFRLELLSRFLGLAIFKLQYDIAHKKIGEVEILLKQLKGTDYSLIINQFNNEIKNLEDSLLDLEEDKQYFFEQYENYQIEVGTLKSMIQEVQEESNALEYDENKFNKIYEESKNLITSHLQDLRNNENKKKQLRERLETINKEELEEQTKNKKKIESDINKLKIEIAKSESQLNTEKDKIKILEDQSWLDDNQQCKVCKFYEDANQIRNEHNIIHEKIEKLKNALNQKDEELKKINELEIKLNKYNNETREIETLESNIKINRLNIDKLKLQTEKIKTAISKYSEKVQQIDLAKQIKESNEVINGIIYDKESQISKVKKQIDSTDYNIVSHAKRITELEDQIKLNEENLSKLQEIEIQYLDYQSYLKCVHREGLPYIIICNYIDIINSEIDKIISDYAPFKLKFEIDLEKKQIPINLINERGLTTPVELGSGAEKFISAMAIRTALCSIANIPRSDILIIDESFGQLDKEYLPTIDKLLSRLKDFFSNIILVTHVTEMQDYVDQSINIEVIDGFSRIEN